MALQRTMSVHLSKWVCSYAQTLSGTFMVNHFRMAYISKEYTIQR